MDGGGAWALIQVRALQEMFGEQAEGHAVLGTFDIGIANSGGTLVLGGLIENRRLDEIAEMFRDGGKRRRIFESTGLSGRLNNRIGLGPRYSAAAKQRAIEAFYDRAGGKMLPQAVADLSNYAGRVPHVVFVAYDYDRNRATFFRSSPMTHAGHGGLPKEGVTLAQAIHASTNAPVNYFDEPACFAAPFPRYWDGGVTGNNNPALAGLTEAVGLGAQPHDVRILSIGTATQILPLRQENERPSPLLQEPGQPGLVADIKKLAKSILGDPPDAATFIAHMLSGGTEGLPPGVPSRVVRMNPMVRPIGGPGAWRPPDGIDLAQFRALCEMDVDAVGDEEVALIDRLARVWLNGAPINQPIRYNSATFAPELGHASFPAAKQAWLAMTT
jgi:hypothetical protein